MEHRCSRRSMILGSAAAGAAVSGAFLWSGASRTTRAQDAAQPHSLTGSNGERSVVSLIRGESRRQNVHDSLVAVEDRLQPLLQSKKHVVIKPNIVSTRRQIASTRRADWPEDVSFAAQ